MPVSVDKRHKELNMTVIEDSVKPLRLSDDRIDQYVQGRTGPGNQPFRINDYSFHKGIGSREIMSNWNKKGCYNEKTRSSPEFFSKG
jgi:hypothetical protein